MTGNGSLGVPQLDRVLDPVPEGTPLLLLNEPGVEGEPFLYQSAAHHASQGRDVVFVVTNRSPESIRRSMDEFDLSVPDPDRLHFVDAYSPGMGLSEGAAYDVKDPKDPGAFVEAIERASEDHPDAFLAIDGLNHLLDNASLEEVAGFLPRLRAALRTFTLSLSLFIRWPYEEDLTGVFETFDGVVRLRGVEGRILLSQYFQAERADWLEHVDTNPRLYKAIRPGGVYVYIPKIVVTGPYNAGKSTFVRSIADASVSVDRMGTTVALDHGHVTVDGIAVDVFGTPGQSRFDPILRTIGDRGLGVLLVVDASRPNTFDRAREMLEGIWRYGTPALVVANKQDLPGALTPSEVAAELDLPASVKAVGCEGQDPGSARGVLRELIDEVMTSGVMTDAFEDAEVVA